jgi:phytoene dehydrogenase-like protein
MEPNERKIAIVGAGIAGLCAAVYARRCGYDVDVFEQHQSAGGLATSWRRGDYTFETCLHWLLGSNPRGMLHDEWREVFDIDSLSFVDQEEYVTLEDEHGERLTLYTSVDRMESELLRVAPQDAAEIRHFAGAIRRLAKFQLPDPSAAWPEHLLQSLNALPYLPLLHKWSGISLEDYGQRFHHPLLRSFFASGQLSRLSALAVLFSFAWMNDRNAGYPIGGSQAVIRGIVERLNGMGGRLHFGAKVRKILVQDDAAVGVELETGATVAADWVISAADGHATIYDLLAGAYVDQQIEQIYRTRETFPSYLQVSFGVAGNLSSQGPFVTRLLDPPLVVDPGTSLGQLSFRFFHFDPTFAPPGKTAVTCFLPTRNFDFWLRLQTEDPPRYQAEKQRVRESVTIVLEKMLPDLRTRIEVADVSTPATVIRDTGNWKGSMEGWLLTPGDGFKALPNTLPGLRQFLMAGQWTMPGGGLPSGLMTARSAVQAICKHDRVRFAAGKRLRPAA